MKERISDYGISMVEILWRMKQRITHNHEKEGGAQIIVESSSLEINRKTKDLELYVTGTLQGKNGKIRRGQYKIGIAMWNYSRTVPEGIEQEIYEEVMNTERDALFATYLDAYVNISYNEQVKVTK